MKIISRKLTICTIASINLHLNYNRIIYNHYDIEESYVKILIEKIRNNELNVIQIDLIDNNKYIDNKDAYYLRLLLNNNDKILPKNLIIPKELLYNKLVIVERKIVDILYMMDNQLWYIENYKLHGKFKYYDIYNLPDAHYKYYNTGLIYNLINGNKIQKELAWNLMKNL